MIDPLGLEVFGASEKIHSHHYERLAVVYVRQSSMQQVLSHQESTSVQYGLVRRALSLGWSEDRTLVIDSDLGKSGSTSTDRLGFQRLVSEVSLNHVGLILGVDISRLARSCKDWYQLLELCGFFKTLISDLDGIYDPCDYNDRLLLGLKGTMSEAELHLIKQRMRQGLLHKAQRGALSFRVPTGYVLSSSGEIIMDPDSEVQSVISLVFRKYEELRTVNSLLRYLVGHDVQLGMRLHCGCRKGELEWRRPNRATLISLLKHPMYAGAYVYGRRRSNRLHHHLGKSSPGRVYLPLEEWLVLLKDRLPAYISWEHYERNLAQLKSNQQIATQLGSARNGSALLSGLLFCPRCGCRLSAQYRGQGKQHSYLCFAQVGSYAAPSCQHISGRVLDEFVSSFVLSALEPAALEVSLSAASHVESERNQLHNLWQARLERAAYAADRAARHYQQVEPENRLVARSLAQDWEKKLSHHHHLQQEYARFIEQQPLTLSSSEKQSIRQLSSDIPTLWHSSRTSSCQRKEIIRQLISRIIVNVQGLSEKVDITIHWIGGGITEAVMRRPVAKLTQLSYYPQLSERVRILRQEGYTSSKIAEVLNTEGFRPARQSLKFTKSSVSGLCRLLGLTGHAKTRRFDDQLREHEWWISDLAQRLEWPVPTLYSWLRRDLLQARQVSDCHNSPWAIWADESEIQRLLQLRDNPPGEQLRKRWRNEQLKKSPIFDERPNRLEETTK